MKTVGLFTAKTKLSELCAQVEETGVEYMITRRGKPVARLVAPGTTRPRNHFLDLSIVQAVAAWEAAHPGECTEAAAEFPDVWMDRQGSKPSPFAEPDGENEG